MRLHKHNTNHFILFWTAAISRKRKQRAIPFYAMLLYPSTSLNLDYSWLVYLRSKLSKPSIFLKLFSLRRKLLWESCQNSRKSSKRSKLENLRIFFSLCRTVVKEEISVTKTKPILNEQNERISASVTVSTYIRRRTH